MVLYYFLVFSKKPFQSYSTSAIISGSVHLSALIMRFSMVALPLVMCAGNGSSMAELGGGDARGPRPQWCAYALAK